MTKPRLSATLILLVAVFATPLLAQTTASKDGPPGIAWQPDWKSAVAAAKESGKPIWIACILKDETANEEVLKQHFTDPALIQASRDFVCLLAGHGFHGDQEGVRYDGTLGQVHPMAGSVSSKEIAAVEDHVRRRILEASTVSCPQYLFMNPEGEEVLLRHVWMCPKQTLMAKMTLARSFLDPSLADAAARSSLDQVSVLLDKAVSKDRTTRTDALDALAVLDDPRIPTFLIERTQDHVVADQRLEAISAMGQPGNAKVLPRLHELLRAKDVDTRVRAAVAIGRIGMADSALALHAALKKDRQDRVRTHLFRALSVCETDKDALRVLLLKATRSRNDLEVITALWLLKDLKPDRDVPRALQALFAHRDDEVRTAAYVTTGRLAISELEKEIRKRLHKEGNLPRDAALWALAELGGEPYGGTQDPETAVYDLLPDNSLHED